MPILAHPLLVPGGLGVPPLAAAVGAMLLVAAAARFWPGPGRLPSGEPGRVFSWSGSLGPARAAGRAAAVALTALAVAAGRVGDRSEIANLAPALVIGAAWPLLVLGSAIVGPVWRWLDPWDGAARLADRSDEAGSADVRWAAVPALVWAWYLAAFPHTLDPRNVGLVLGAYSMVTVAGCLFVGRVAWLSRAEPFGLLFGWTAKLPRGWLPGWRPPGGAETVLGVLAGGLLFGAVRLSDLWGRLNVVPGALLFATLGLAAASGGFAALLWGSERWARRLGAGGSVAATAVPAVAGLAVALAMSRNRLTTSLQLLPGLLVDPFGAGDWPLARGVTIDPDPLGATGLVAVQVAFVLLGALAGAVVLARRERVERRAPAMAALCLVAGAGVAAVTAV